MQFQDITRQKLERLHKPTLQASAESLSLLSHETRALLQRDLYRAVKAYSQSGLQPKGGRESLEADGRRLDEVGAAAGEPPAAPPPEDKKVEIF
jgi:hypothetical protein